MEAAGIRFVVDPLATALVLAYVASGICLGTISGLTPGLHANTFALLLASLASAVPGPPQYVAAAMLAAGVVHTFLDIVPSLALGVPDPAMAATALPGHRLVLEGRGREALRLSALGSGLAVLAAVPLAIPLTKGMRAGMPWLEAHLSVVLTAVVAVLIMSEPDRAARIGAALAFAASAALGFAALDLPVGGVVPIGNTLAPLFAGLFGAPILLDSIGGAGVPPQDEPVVLTTRWLVVGLAAMGTLAGAVVGFLPGVSSAIAATMVLLAMPRARGAREFVVATSGVNTATAIFALVAFVTFGSTRTGVVVAVDSVNAPQSLALWLLAIAIASLAGFTLVILVGDRYLRVVGRLDNTRLSVGVLALLVVLLWLLSGVVGLGIFLAATAVGLLPPRVGARRVSLMGVLLGPLIL
ncbi:Tripartite tricarboxylate transporter (TTT) class transporter [Halapricum desulfuricans]|uniref:Tripartite tricarboxylate transporter (TTT) class transporter n=1 Tax=Halapricum desulfuricans TaxID=2841257 RepID=A0A897NLV8_9EURY|nr:tripartite tricarboxylate transporter permease [Halapricum desulfuricans]QSG12445.1 Tripartite tricarboxylate transporter (TTT) class transporter [Halapricum desulfuricans]